MSCRVRSQTSILLFVFRCMFCDLAWFLLFIYLFQAVLGLRSCTRALSSCGKQGVLLVTGHASHCSGSSCRRARALGMRAQ